MFINKNALRRCCVGIALSSLCSVSGMGSLKPEMINEAMLKATVDKYKEVICGMRNYKTRVYIGLVLQTLVDNCQIDIEGFVEGKISDDFWDTVAKFTPSINEECLWLYGNPYTVVKKYIDFLGVWQSAGESDNKSFINRLRRINVARSHVIDMSWLTKEFIDQCIEKMVADMVVKKEEVEVVASPSADLADVSDEIKRILPRGEYFRDFIVLLSELHERSGYSIALPSVSDFVSLGRRFIALVAEKSELEKKVAQIEQEKKKIEDEKISKISLENELKLVQDQLKDAWKYSTDGVYTSDGNVKVVKTIEPADLNGIASGVAMEKVGVYDNEAFGLVSKKNEEKAKLLDNGTHDVYEVKTQDVYDTGTHVVVTNERLYQMDEVSRRSDLILYDLEVLKLATGSQLTIDCRKHSVRRIIKKYLAEGAREELDIIFPHIKRIASWFLNIDYARLSVYELVVNKVVKEILLTQEWEVSESLRAGFNDKTPPDLCSYMFVVGLNSAIEASATAANVTTKNLLACKVGNANDVNGLRVQLLLAAIAGCDVEDIKATF